jgi:hypothetical protein
MPSKSGKQHRLMALVANDPKAAKRLGIPKSVGQEYMKADKGRKFAIGGVLARAGAAGAKYLSKKAAERATKKSPQDPPPVGKTPGAYRDPAAKREADKAMRERIKQAEAEKDKLRSVARPAERNKDRLPYEPRPQSDESSYRKGGSVKSSASRRADGIAQRGKTRGKFI